MKIEKLSATTGGIGYSKKNNAKTKENNVSFTRSIKFKKMFMSLPLVLATLGISTNANAGTTSNDNTNVEMVSNNYNAPQQNTDDNLKWNILVSDLPSNVRKFVQDNHIDADGNEEINSQELLELCQCAKNQAYANMINNPTLNLPYYNNVDDIARNCVNTHISMKEDKEVLDGYIKYTNNAIETLNKKDTMTYNQDEQIAIIDNLYGNVSTKCDEFLDDMQIRCKNFDDAVFNMVKSLKTPQEKYNVSREDYSFSSKFCANEITNRIQSFKKTLGYRLDDIKEGMQYNHTELAYFDILRIVEDNNVFLNTMTFYYEKALLDNHVLSSVLDSVKNNGNLNEEQMTNYTNLINMMEQNKAAEEKYKEQVQKWIDIVKGQLEDNAVFHYKPNERNLEKIYVGLENHSDVLAQRYDNMSDAFEKFGNSDELMNINATVESNKNQEISRYHNAIQNIEEISHQINDNSTTKQDIESCKKILDLLIGTREANNRAAYDLTRYGLQGMIDAVDKVPDATAIEHVSDNNISPQGNIKVYDPKSKRIIIKSQGSNGENNKHETKLNGIEIR